MEYCITTTLSSPSLHYLGEEEGEEVKKEKRQEGEEVKKKRRRRGGEGELAVVVGSVERGRTGES